MSDGDAIVPYVMEPMRLEDIPEVTEIERQSFTTPWPVYAYRREIKDNRNSRYIVARWIELDEERAHGECVAVQVPAAEAPKEVQPGLRGILAGFWPFSRRNHSVRDPEVLRSRGAVVGYAGLWLIHDEGHITTIATRPDVRGQGIGELMLIRLTELALGIGADRLTLEVRVSNTVAQNLYRKYTFKVEGVRRRYYSDDNEDALIMWSDPIHGEAFQANFSRLREALYQRLGDKLRRTPIT